MQEGYALAANQSAERHQQEATILAKYATEVANVKDAETEKAATEFLKQVKTKLDQIEYGRKALTEPLNKHVKNINLQFKQISVPLEEADKRVRASMTAYRNSQQFKEAAAVRVEIEIQARQAVAEGDIKTLQALSEDHAVASEAAPKKVLSETGEARFRKVWKWEITELEKLPAGYWVPDEKKIAAAVKAGITIEGVKAWQEDTPVIL